MSILNEQALLEKWSPVLDHDALPGIKNDTKRKVTALMLENTENFLREERQALMEAGTPPANAAGAMPDTGGVAKYDPVLIGLVRRTVPQMIAFDIFGVQPLKQPTGLVFYMKSRYGTQGGTEALFNEADTNWSAGAALDATPTRDPSDAGYEAPTGSMTTAQAEELGTAGTPAKAFNEMAFSIERTSVVAGSRALRAQYTVELAQDLKAVHGLDAEAELQKILSTEIAAEMNREIIRKVYTSATAGAEQATTPGTFDLDVDANGRWSVERFKGLMFQLEREANRIAQQTRIGRGNWILCSSDVASALAMAGVLDYAPAIKGNDVPDEASSTFAGTLNGRFKVYVDPYSSNGTAGQYAVVGYKGNNELDAGAYYCPYVPLTMYRAVDPNSYQPSIGYKTRYGLVDHPFSQVGGKNVFFRKINISNIL